MSGISEYLQIVIGGDASGAEAAVSKVRASVFNLKLELEKYQSMAFTEKDEAKIRSYNARIQELEKQITQTANIGKQGFNEMGDAIKKSGNGLTGMLSGVRTLAYIIPGIGVAGIFNLAFEAIGKVVSEMNLFHKTVDRATQSEAELNKELVKTRESAEQEASHLKALISVAQNHSASSVARKKAIKDLRDDYPAYFKDLTDEKIKTGDITTATDLLTAAIYKRAEARAREADIAKKATTVFENEQKVEKLNLDIAKAKADANAKSAKAVQPIVGSAAQIDNATQVRSGAAIDAEKHLNDLIAQRTVINTENLRLRYEIEKSQSRLNSLEATAITAEKDKGKAGNVDEDTKAYTELSKQLAEIQKMYSDARITNGQYNKESMAAIDSTLKKLDTTSKYYEKIIALQDMFLRENKEKGGLAETVSQDLTKEQKDDMKFAAPTHLTGGKNGSGILDEGIEALNSKDTEKLNDLKRQLGEVALVANAAGNAIGGLFDAMASGENLGDALGRMFKDLAKQIITAAAKAIIFKVILSALNITTGGIAGTAGSIIGGAISGAANGAVVTGPNILAVGEGGESETVLPISRLSSMLDNAAAMGSGMGGVGGSTIMPKWKIEGDQLLVWIDRSSQAKQIRG